MGNNNRVLYIGQFGLPNDAASIRVYNNAKLLSEIGYEVYFACLQSCCRNAETIEFEPSLRYLFIPKQYNLTFLGKIRATLDLLIAQDRLRWIKKLINEISPSIIILYNDLFCISLFLNWYCGRKGIKLVSDVTEWYEKRKVKKNIADYFVPFLTDKRIRFVDPKIGNIIAISPYLTDYYTRKGCNVISIPPVFDLRAGIEIAKYNYYDSRVINFLYAGSPGAKDLIEPFVRALMVINRSELKIRLDIIGIDYEFFLNSFSLSSEVLNNCGVYLHGRIPHDQVFEYLRKSDFSILLRNNLRYAKAGFSTKFAECMSNGVAMFANEVGGAESLITNYHDGIVIEDCAVNHIVSELHHILELSDLDILAIRKEARKKALELFSRDTYKQEMQQFISKI